jgi:hypothetical protein
MGKVSIGLRGWRFDEDEVFDERGEFRSLDEMSEDTEQRLLRLTAVHDDPCDACWLVHGDDEIQRCRVATVVYGEPFAEVLLCDEHERDFYYWYFEAGGEEHRGTEAFQDRFHEWFAAGNRAPEGYVGLEHEEQADADVPSPEVPDAEAFAVDLPEDERVRYDLREVTVERGAEVTFQDDEDGEDVEDALAESDVDLDADYPT